MEDYRSSGSGGGCKGISKRPWDIMNGVQPDGAGHWQEQEKRLCLPDAYEIVNPNIPLTLTTIPLMLTAPPNPPSLVAPSLNFSSMSEASSNFGANVDLEASPMFSQFPPDWRIGHSLRSVSHISSSFGTANSSEESWALKEPPDTPDPCFGSSEVCAILRPGSYTRGEYMPGSSNHQTPLAYPNVTETDFLGLTNTNGDCIQHSELGSDVPVTPVGFSRIDSLYLPPGVSPWSQPSLPNIQKPQPELSPSFIDWSSSFDASIAQSFNQDGLPSRYLSQNATVNMLDRIITENQDSKPVLLQQQKTDSPNCDSQFSPSSDTDDQISCSTHAVSKIVSTSQIGESNSPPRADSPLSIELMDNALENEVTKYCSPLYTGGAGNKGTFEHDLSEQEEKTNEVGYDTCFGMVRSAKRKAKPQNMLADCVQSRSERVLSNCKATCLAPNRPWIKM